LIWDFYREFAWMEHEDAANSSVQKATCCKVGLIMRYVALLAFFYLGTALAAQECTQAVPAIFLNETTREAVPSNAVERPHAKIGKVAIPITALEPIRSFRVLILIDTSGSMDPSNKPFVHQRKALELVKQLLDELLEELPPYVRVEYGVFNKNADFGPEFTADADLLRKSLTASNERTNVHRNKSTALYDALGAALERFGPPEPGDSILALSDGGDNTSHAKPENIQEEAARKGVRIFTALFLGGGVPSSPTEGSPQTVLDFAERTGGSVHVIDVTKNDWVDDKKRENAKQDLRRFWNNEVLSGYLLHFILPASARNQRKWLLSVDRLPGQNAKILATYPSRLNACPVATATAH
jgi:hypothetical protein